MNSISMRGPDGLGGQGTARYKLRQGSTDSGDVVGEQGVRERERELGEEESSCREEQGPDGFYRERALGRERYGRRVQDAIDGVHQWGEGVMGEGEEMDALQLITR
jgi:hypothetical protein